MLLVPEKRRASSFNFLRAKGQAVFELDLGEKKRARSRKVLELDLVKKGIDFTQ